METFLANKLAIYTDGSLAEGKAGAEVFSETQNLSLQIPLGAYASVFQAETVAWSFEVRHTSRNTWQVYCDLFWLHGSIGAD